MNATELLQKLEQRQIRVTVDGERLRVTPSSALTDELRQSVREAKAELIKVLNVPPSAATPTRVPQYGLIEFCKGAGSPKWCQLPVGHEGPHIPVGRPGETPPPLTEHRYAPGHDFGIDEARAAEVRGNPGHLVKVILPALPHHGEPARVVWRVELEDGLPVAVCDWCGLWDAFRGEGAEAAAKHARRHGVVVTATEPVEEVPAITGGTQ